MNVMAGVDAPFDSGGIQRPRKMLYIFRAPSTAPSLERSARRVVVAQSRPRDGTLVTDVLLCLVAY